jgi:O-antigen ligase
MVGLASRWRPMETPLLAGAFAFVTGFVKTYRGGVDLDLGLGVIALAVALFLLRDAWQGPRERSIDLAGFALFIIAILSVLSLVASVGRIRAFVVAPGFGYHTYAVNELGLSSDEVVVRAIFGATACLLWFGLYEYARSFDRGRPLGAVVFTILFANAVALIVQRGYSPSFLHPHGYIDTGRLNGLTSFCYALGDGVLSLFLLLPVWAGWRGWRGVMTAASLVLIAHAAFVSGSRTAVLALLVATLLWTSVRVTQWVAARRRWAAVAGAVGIVAFLAATTLAYRFSPDDDQSTPLGRLKFEVSRHGWYGHLFATRLYSYPLLFRIMARYPLSGVGAGLYMAEVRKQQQLLMPQLGIPDPYLMASYAPNEFLNTGAELGFPALVALLAVFAVAFGRAVRSRRQPSLDLAMSVVTLGVALQFGPSFYNSEALVFLWMVLGLASRTNELATQEVSGRRTGVALALTAAVAIAGQVLALPSLSIERQWRQLRWRMAMGMYHVEPGGQWSRPEATFPTDAATRAVKVLWHAGDSSDPNYRAEVSFFVDGVPQERTVAAGGLLRESTLALPAVPGWKRISVRVTPPYAPHGDPRLLGIFIHSVSPLP